MKSKEAEHDRGDYGEHYSGGKRKPDAPSRLQCEQAGRVGGHAALSGDPRYRPEVDNDAGVPRLHVRQHGLRRKELVLQIHGDAVVPIFWRHLLGVMPFVMRGIVDEDIDRAVRVARLRDAGA